MPDPKSVKGSDSLTDETPESRSAAGEDQPSKSGDDRPEKNYKAELERKNAELKELREQLQSAVSDKEERIAELSEKTRLSSSEKEELESLEEQVAAIKRDPRSKAWQRLNRDISSEVAAEKTEKLAAEFAKDYIEEVAIAEKIELDKFERVIVPYMRRVDPGAEMSPYIRAKKAVKAYREELAIQKRLEDLKAKEKEYAEVKSPSPARNMSKRELVEDALKNPKSMEEMLKGIATLQEDKHR